MSILVEEHYFGGMNLPTILDNLFMLMTHKFTCLALFCSTAYLTSLLGCLRHTRLNISKAESCSPAQRICSSSHLSHLEGARDLECLGCHDFPTYKGLRKRVNGCVAPPQECSAHRWSMELEAVLGMNEVQWGQTELDLLSNSSSASSGLCESLHIHDQIIFLSNGNNSTAGWHAFKAGYIKWGTHSKHAADDGSHFGYKRYWFPESFR